MTRRDFALASISGFASVTVGQEPTPTAPMGLLLYSYGQRQQAETNPDFSNPISFLRLAKDRGANAVQMPLGIRTEAETTEIHRLCDRLGLGLEGIVTPARATVVDRDRFRAELATARAAGARVIRVAMLSGRRYEQFQKADEYRTFARDAAMSLEWSEPIARTVRVTLAVENHKDFRTDEQVDLLKRLASEWIGVCVDTGNNLALLEDPHAVVEALAPYARTVHLKDLGVEEASDGFRMAEVPLGQGMLDLKRIVTTLRRAQPKIPMHLEMITRDPLVIPCLTEKYWATLGTIPGRDLARTLARVRAAPKREPLPIVSDLTKAERLAREDLNVRESFAFAARSRLLVT